MHPCKHNGIFNHIPLLWSTKDKWHEEVVKEEEKKESATFFSLWAH